jgi:hypothetical protein
MQRNVSASAIAKSLGARSLNFRAHLVKSQRIYTKLLSYLLAFEILIIVIISRIWNKVVEY